MRRTFGELGTAAIRTRIRESNAYAAHWITIPDLVWVRWPREDGRYAYCALRRRDGWLSGEIGSAPQPLALDELKLVGSLGEASGEGTRIALGALLGVGERWWPLGDSEKALIERLDWIALQLEQHLPRYLAATALPPAA